VQQIAVPVLAEIVRLASDAIVVIDATQRIRLFNDGAAAVFGYAADEVLDRPLDVLLPERVHGVHRAHVRAFADAPVAARRMGERSLVAGRRRDGTEFPAEAAITRVAAADGPVYAVVLRDITERHRAEQVHERLLREMRDAVQARDEMLGLVTHDLRNPVNAVKMLAAAILRAHDEPAATRDEALVAEHAAVMLQAAQQMDRLIQDLLDVTRLEAGRLRLVPAAVAPDALVAGALETLAPLAVARGVTLRVEIPAGLPPVHADRDRIGQVVSNLVGNAIKYTAAGGSARLVAEADGAMVRFAVHDTGIGIAEDDLPFVFDRYWQSRRTNRSGAGLGLAIARGIVEAHGGTIRLRSRVGEGTAVEFTVPVASAPV
jgi:PAS domain S-box-containing protein